MAVSSSLPAPLPKVKTVNPASPPSALLYAIYVEVFDANVKLQAIYQELVVLNNNFSSKLESSALLLGAEKAGKLQEKEVTKKNAPKDASR